MCPLVALHVEQGVAVVDGVSSLWTDGNILTLAVSGDEEAMGCRDCSCDTGRTLWTV